MAQHHCVQTKELEQHPVRPPQTLTTHYCGSTFYRQRIKAQRCWITCFTGYTTNKWQSQDQNPGRPANSYYRETVITEENSNASFNPNYASCTYI